jgi:hypothetical protein
MPIQVKCVCGRSLKAKEELVGRKVRCPACGAVQIVPQQEAAPDVEEDAAKLLLDDSPAASAPGPGEPTDLAGLSSEGQVRKPAPAPQLPASPPPATKSAEPSRRKKSKRARDARWSVPTIEVNREIVAGCLMMAGAALWFFLGLAAGIIYFYPPILFILGIGAIFRGFSGGD